MTTLAIIGRGRAATVHAESSRSVAGLQLIGVGGRSSGRTSALADALGCDELTVDEMVERADVLVVAVPPSDTADVLAQIPPDRPVIVESPVAVDPATNFGDRPYAMLGANLLHAPIGRRGLAAITDLGDPHHLVLRANGVRPSWHCAGSVEGGVTLDLGGRLLPVLLAAARRPVVEVSARLTPRNRIDFAAELDLRLSSGRRVRAELVWGAGSTDTGATAVGPTRANLEAATANTVVSLELWPFPVLEVDGSEVASAQNQGPLHALGFVSQLKRLVAVAKEQAAPWPELSSGIGALRIAEAARLSARCERPVRLA